MDNVKSFIKAMAAGMAAFLLWMLIAPRLFPQRSQTSVSPEQAAVPGATTRPAATTGPATATGPQSAPAGGLTAAGASKPQSVMLGQPIPDGPWRMEVVCTNRGAGVERVLLNDFDEKLGSDERYELMAPVVDHQTGAAFDSLAVERIWFVQKQQGVDLADCLWTAEKRTTDDAEEAIFQSTIRSGNKDLVRISRVYRLQKRPVQGLRQNDPERLRHDLIILTSVQNLSGEPQDVVLTSRGPTGLRKEDPRSDNRLALVALGSIEKADFTTKKRTDVVKKGDAAELMTSPDEKFLYATLTNKYFTTILFSGVADLAPQSDFLMKVQAAALIPHQEPDKNDDHNRSDLTLRFTTKPLALAPGESKTTGFDCYFGPKSKTAFEKLSPYKERHYYHMVEQEYYWCAWAPLTNAMINFFQWIYGVPPHNYGIAIILLVFIVRLLLHPVTKKGQKDMVRMQQQMATLQPRLEEAKKKYANDKARLNQATMEIYRDAGVSPAGQMLTCLPMFLQMPVWGALWTALSFTVEMRHQGFMLWIRDLTAPDALISFGTTVNIPLVSALTGPIHSLNVLPILLGVSMYLQQRFMPKAAKAEKAKRQSSDQMQQQKMMMWMMTVMFTLMFYNAPSGLTLYIMASTAAGVVEQWRIREHLKQEEAAGPRPRKPGWFKKPKFLEKLEKLAEEAREQQQQAARSKTDRK